MLKNSGKRSAPEQCEGHVLDSAPCKKNHLSSSVKEDEDEEGMDEQGLVTAAMDIVEGLVLQSSTAVVEVLKASYEKDVYADVLYAEFHRSVAEMTMGLRVERNVIVPIVGLGRVVGTLKIQFAFFTGSGRPLLLVEVKTKKTSVKECDMEGLGCAVEQMALATGKQRPRAMIVNFSAGTHTSMVMHCDGTITN